MGENKVVKMKIKVDLQCSKCYKKIKKVLCRFHEIRDQVYDEKANTVTITVVCCNPEKIKEKICCKAGDTILGIETIPDKPKEPVKDKEPEKLKEPEKPNTKLVVIFQPTKEAPAPPKQSKEDPPKTKEKPKPPAPAPAPAPAQPICICPGYPVPLPVCAPGVWGCPCSQGYGGGMYYGGYARMPPPMCSDGCGRPASACSDGCGRPASACSDGCGRPAYACQGAYFSDENPSGCMVM